MGSVTPCKVLGSLELIDSGETDHKILCVAAGSEDYDLINSVSDLETFRPGVLDDLVMWMKYYKTSDGKGVNELGNGERPISREQALAVVDETNGFWKKLCKGRADGDTGFDLSGCP